MSDREHDPVVTAAQTLVNEAFSLKEVVSETRADVKTLVAWSERTDVRLEDGQRRLVDHEARLRRQEAAGLRLSGAWTTLAVLGAVITGSAGLVVSAVSLWG